MQQLLFKIYPLQSEIKNSKTEQGLSLFRFVFFNGGDGGNRNRVRKPIPTNFYECSLLFVIPLKARHQAGLLLR